MFPSEPAFQMIEMKHCISYKTDMNPTNHHDTQLKNCTWLCYWCFITPKWTGTIYKRVGRVLSSEHILDGQGAERSVHSVECRNDHILPWIIKIIIVNTVFGKEKGAAESMAFILKCLSTLSSFWYHNTLLSSYWNVFTLFMSNE